ncbi:MAG: fatty acid oxidation complex subunit alpha FadJ [Myxococcota bacterium]
MAEQALRIERRADGVALLVMDVPDEPVNTLKSTFADEFARAFDELEQDASVKAVVFTSGKEGTFIVGADIHMLQRAETAEQAAELSRQGQQAMNRIERFPKPVVAAIHGSCLGGGLETAMACGARVATDDRRTQLGQPEVQLGLLPGAGGTQRLPRLVGVQRALDLMLTGKQVAAKQAAKMGLVDEVVPKAILVDVAVEHARRLLEARPSEETVTGRLRRLLEPEELQELLLAENPVGRRVLFSRAREELRKRTRGNYPAPEKILDAVRTGLEHGFDAGLEAEAKAFGELVASPEAEQLIQLFFAQQDLRKDRGVDAADVEPKKVRRVGVLGAGLMGAGITYVTMQRAGLPVRLKDKDDQGLRSGLKHVRELVDKGVKHKRMSPQEGDALMYRVGATVDYSGFQGCDLVIEAVFEDLELKQRMVREVEAHGPEDVIFASNTSSLPIRRIAEASEHPETVIGMHYFSPVHKMPLLEIITTERTADWVTATCVEVGKKQGKTVIVVGDGPGFYTTRILAPFMNEAFFVLSEGVPVEKIDRALTQFGFPVGPIKLTDEVGIDVGAKVGKVMQKAFGQRMEAPEGMQKLQDDDRQGRKNKRGFYRYDGGKGVDETVYRVLGIEPRNTGVADEDIAWRVTLQMVNEAALCFGEGILRSARDGDVGAVFGLGFPPFRGGPFRFVDRVGPREVVDRLHKLQDRHGERFEPAPVLVEMAGRNQRFHGDGAVRPGGAAERAEQAAARL